MIHVENRLWATAVQLADEAGMQFTVPCSHNVRDFIDAGVRDMKRENRWSDSDLEEADSSISRLVREMIEITSGLGITSMSGGKIAIREGALVDAKKKLSRLWPYC